MNITSIGGRELYSILLGKESPFGSSSSEEQFIRNISRKTTEQTVIY
mgnify:CR=1 FL=1